MTGKPLPPRPGQGAAAARLAEILRVDDAGELGAVAIYRGQRAVLGQARGHEHAAGQLEAMEAHEVAHLARFDTLLNARRVRPTALAPLWRLAGFALGAGTALMEKCLDAARAHGFKRCYLETLCGMTAAQKLYERSGFARLEAPMGDTGHGGCNTFFAREL